MSYTEDAGRVHCQELLYCSQPAWEAFCGSCTQLREVNWFVLPFIDDFFEVFAADHKPKLEKLTLTAGDHEDFPDTVMLGHYSRMDDGKRRQTAWAKCSSAVPTFDVVFDDTALIALAKHCRSLEKLQIEWLQSPDGVLIHDVTDADITAIASLASLRSIQLKSIACGLPGVLELLRHAPTEGALREVEMFTGETKGVQIDSFHKRAISLFQALMSKAPDSERRRFCLTITGHVNLRKPETSKNRDGMKTLVHEVGVALPWLAVSIKESRTITTIVTQSHAHHPLLLHRQSSQLCALNACNMGPSEPTGSWRPLGSYLWQVLG